MSEEMLAQAVINWLEGFDVYQEVQIHSAGKRADIVTDCGGYGWIIECKRSLGFAVLEQAYEWRRMGVRRVSIAVYRSRAQGRRFAKEVCKKYGIGLVEVNKDRELVNERVEPAFNRLKNAMPDILEYCKPQHKIFAAAGSRNGGHYTPFTETCRQLTAVVKASPGICLKDAVHSLQHHHYASTSSARSAFGYWLKGGQIKGVRTEKQGNRLALFPVEAAAAGRS